MVKPGKTALSEDRMESLKRGHGLGIAAPISQAAAVLCWVPPWVVTRTWGFFFEKQGILIPAWSPICMNLGQWKML